MICPDKQEFKDMFECKLCFWPWKMKMVLFHKVSLFYLHFQNNPKFSSKQFQILSTNGLNPYMSVKRCLKNTDFFLFIFYINFKVHFKNKFEVLLKIPIMASPLSIR